MGKETIKDVVGTWHVHFKSSLVSSIIISKKFGYLNSILNSLPNHTIQKKIAWFSHNIYYAICMYTKSAIERLVGCFVTALCLLWGCTPDRIGAAVKSHQVTCW